MSIFDKMKEITSGKIQHNEVNEEIKPIIESAKHGDVIQGIITNLIYPSEDGTKKGGFGFISSTALPYERIFFHWSSLKQDTLRFPELEKKMKVEFELKYSESTEQYDGGYRAVKIKVL